MIIRSSYIHTPKEASITTPITTPIAAPLEISEDDEITQYIHPPESSDDEEEPLQSTSTLQYMHPTQPISEIQHIINKVAAGTQTQPLGIANMEEIKTLIKKIS